MDKKEMEKLRFQRRKHDEKWIAWRKEYQRKNRKKLSEAAREYYHKNKERLNLKAREWREKNKEKLRGYHKKHNAKEPLRRAARKFVSHALTAKVIIRSEICEICAKACIPEAHHEDYTKPLDVKWLCRSCHGFIHRSF